MYRLHPPDPALAPFIASYWAVADDDGPVDLSVDAFVDARADLIFTFGAPYQRDVIGGGTQEIGFSNLDAQRLVPVRIRQQGHVRVFGVRFALGGVGVFTDGPLAPFTGLTPRPEAVFGAHAVELETRLREVTSVEQAARHLDAFFLAALRRTDDREAVERALTVLTARDGNVEVREVAAAVGVSGRQLERSFARQVGVAPKVVARVLRFQRSMRALMRDPGVPLADVAIDCGYFDQAHFIREFRRMTGGVPRGYRGYYPPDAPTDFAPNVVAYVQDGRRRT